MSWEELNCTMSLPKSVVVSWAGRSGNCSPLPGNIVRDRCFWVAGEWSRKTVRDWSHSAFVALVAHFFRHS